MKAEKTHDSARRASITELERSEMTALAVDAAFNVLGPDLKKAILHHLYDEHGIDINKAIDTVSLAKLQKALVKILGVEGAKILMKQIFLQFEELADDLITE